MNRIECVHETLRHALDVLALAAPEELCGNLGDGLKAAYRGG
jgi:hypothetical protein